MQEEFSEKLRLKMAAVCGMAGQGRTCVWCVTSGLCGEDISTVTKERTSESSRISVPLAAKDLRRRITYRCMRTHTHKNRPIRALCASNVS